MLDTLTSTDALKWHLTALTLWSAYREISDAVVAGRHLTEADIAAIEGRHARSLDTIPHEFPAHIDPHEAIGGARHHLTEMFEEVRTLRERAARKAARE